MIMIDNTGEKCTKLLLLARCKDILTEWRYHTAIWQVA